MELGSQPVTLEVRRSGSYPEFYLRSVRVCLERFVATSDRITALQRSEVGAERILRHTPQQGTPRYTDPSRMACASIEDFFGRTGTPPGWVHRRRITRSMVAEQSRHCLQDTSPDACASTRLPAEESGDTEFGMRRV